MLYQSFFSLFFKIALINEESGDFSFLVSLNIYKKYILSKTKRERERSDLWNSSFAWHQVHMFLEQSTIFLPLWLGSIFWPYIYPCFLIFSTLVGYSSSCMDDLLISLTLQIYLSHISLSKVASVIIVSCLLLKDLYPISTILQFGLTFSCLQSLILIYVILFHNIQVFHFTCVHDECLPSHKFLPVDFNSSYSRKRT